MNVDAALTGVQLGPLLRDVARNDKVEGAGNVSLRVYGGGNDTLSIKRSLNGNGSFSIVNGLIRGVDAQASLYQVEIALEQQNLAALANARNLGGQTPFEQLNGTLDIKNGMVHNRDLVMRAPGITATGSGMLVDLRTEQLKYDFAVGVDRTRVQTAQATNNLGGYKIPIRCRGTITNPSCLPDAGEIGKQFGLNLLKGYLTGQQSGQGGVGGLLQGLVGGAQTPGAPATQAVPQSTRPAPAQAATGTQPPAAAAPQKPQKIEDVLKEKALKGLFGD
jgi:AsmA protein